MKGEKQTAYGGTASELNRMQATAATSNMFKGGTLGM